MTKLVLWNALKPLDHFLHCGRRRSQLFLAESLDDIIAESAVCRGKALQWLQLEERLDIDKRLPAHKQFELEQRHRDLGLMVAVTEF